MCQFLDQRVRPLVYFFSSRLQIWKAMNSRWICFVGLFAVLLLAGCTPAPTTGQVSGKVSVAGKGPLTGGTIVFVSAADAKRVGTGTIKPDGTYDVPNAPLGECKVTVDNLSLKGTAAMGAPPPSVSGQTGAVPKGLEIPTGMGAMGKGTYIPIDPTFAKPESTSLKASVNKGTNTADFEVK